MAACVKLAALIKLEHVWAMVGSQLVVLAIMELAKKAQLTRSVKQAGILSCHV
jgi:hypothetical protein